MINELLVKGKENKRTMAELISLLGVTRREFQDILRAERRDGHLIMSCKENGGGYWLWGGDYAELERYYNMQRTGAIDILETLKPVKEQLRQHEQEKEKAKSQGLQLTIQPQEINISSSKVDISL